MKKYDFRDHNKVGVSKGILVRILLCDLPGRALCVLLINHQGHKVRHDGDTKYSETYTTHKTT